MKPMKYFSVKDKLNIMAFTYLGGGGMLSKLPTGMTPLFALARRGRYDLSLIGNGGGGGCDDDTKVGEEDKR